MQRTIAARPPVRLRKGTGKRASGPGAAAALRTLLTRALKELLDMLRAHRRMRIAALCAVMALPVLGGGWLWFRHSSFVGAEQVSISGVHGAQAAEIESALTEAAHGMSTLAPSVGSLRAAVERFPMVTSISLRASFPHKLAIAVEEEPPVAVLISDGVKTAVAADGVALGASLVSSSLPLVADDVAPATGEHVKNVLVLGALRLLGAAPAALDGVAARVYDSPRGLTVVMDNGLVAFFGDATRPHAKWLALARVLADPSSAGASYIDVELPDRPAAGFSDPEAHSTASPSTTTRAGKEATISSLAAGLAANSSDPATGTTGEPSESTSTTATGESTTGATSSSGESSETSEAPVEEASPEH